MKKYLLSCIAFSVLLFTGCADENMPTTSTESTEPGITVSMDLAANLETPNSPEGTRAIGYKGNENADPTKSHGYPIPMQLKLQMEQKFLLFVSSRVQIKTNLLQKL